MSLRFQNITDFKRGTLFCLLDDAYSYDPLNRQYWRDDWRAFDEFFCDHPTIARRCGFITTLNGNPIGFVSWDPRNMPESAIIGHNCILTAYKGMGYGRFQMQEALRRIRREPVKKILVTTNAAFLPAQRNYESMGFREIGRRANTEFPHIGDYIDYELLNT